MTRALRATVGAVLMVLGLLGAVLFGPWSAGAIPAGTPSHEAMHRMMVEMHGPGAAERMHRVAGAGDKMARCSALMDSMGPMTGMMDGGM
ncbi:MAG: hypothetical protein ACRDGU_07435 [Actinomycetota bacterium]